MRALTASFAVLFVLACVASCVAASVAANGESKRGVSIPMGRHPHTFIPNGVRDTTSHRGIGNAVPMNGGILNFGAFFINISVGSGAGKSYFNTIVDTGSSNTAVPSFGCKTCGTSAVYQADLSPTARKLSCSSPMCTNCVPTPVGMADNALAKGRFALSNSTTCPYEAPGCRDDACTFSISYGGSSTSTGGNIGQDVMCLGDRCATGYVDRILDQWPAATQPTGILGLAFPANACNPTCQPTILDSLVDAGALRPEENLFGMCLTQVSGGVMDLGWYDKNKFDGELQWAPVVKQHWYNLDFKSMLVGNVTLDIPEFLFNLRNDGIGGFPDSGTTTVLVSPYAFQTFSSFMQANYANLQPYLNELLAGNCVTLNDTTIISQFPRVSFTVRSTKADGSTFAIGLDGADYVMEAQPGSNQYCLGISGVPSIGVIIGDIALARYYVVYDRHQARVGFAPIKKCVA